MIYRVKWDKTCVIYGEGFNIIPVHFLLPRDFRFAYSFSHINLSTKHKLYQ